MVMPEWEWAHKANEQARVAEEEAAMRLDMANAAQLAHGPEDPRVIAAWSRYHLAEAAAAQATEWAWDAVHVVDDNWGN
jgi:hypothetical protein